VNFIARIRQRLSGKKPSLVEADAIVLSRIAHNKLLVQVLPVKERNFVTEVQTCLPDTDLYPGQRIRVKYDPAHHYKIEITRWSV
jgi:hypothetical protein